jgi:hypothetical protein
MYKMICDIGVGRVVVRGKFSWNVKMYREYYDVARVSGSEHL